jgi:DNA-binding MarR family transcriptional regulator
MANAERWESWVNAIGTFDRAGRAARQPRRRNGPIGHTGMAIARAIAEECGVSGLLRMKPDELADAAVVSLSAAKRAVKRIAAAGFLIYEPGASGRRATFHPTFPKAAQS